MYIVPIDRSIENCCSADVLFLFGRRGLPTIDEDNNDEKTVWKEDNVSHGKRDI
jgi:hypothetical protein